MDKPRPSQARTKRIKCTVYATLAVLIGSGITLGLSRLKPAAPRVDRATVYIDTVKRGEMLRQVRGLGKLKVEIAETQAKDMQVGESASIDTRNGIIPGTVMRIDPGVVNGTVKGDVRLDGELPRGVRPDLSVDGTVEIERLEDVLYVGRPAYGQANSLGGLFRLGVDGEAVRTQVRLGRTSVSTREIAQGFDVGDEVILSDMSAWDAFDRVQLN